MRSLGGLQPKKPKKNRKKTSPAFEICGSVRFFFVFFRFFFGFFGIFRFFSVFCGTFSVFFGLNFDKEFQSFKNHVNNEVLGGQELPKNILNAYKALQMSYKSYYYQKEPLNKKPLNQSKLKKNGKTEKNRKKPKKNRKKPKKTSPKFEICGSVRVFLGCNPPSLLHRNIKTYSLILVLY